MKILLNRTWGLALFLIIALGAAYYLILGRGAEVSVSEQLLNHHQVIARAEVSNIISFFEKHGDSMATLAQLSSIERRDADVLENLDTFIEQRKDTGIIAGVALTDKAGIVRFNSNVLRTRDIGQSLADRNFFAWAKSEAKKGEYYVSRPVVGRLGASIGQTIVAVASPVYQKGEFSGALVSSVKLQPLVERFFGLMKASDQTAVYLVDESGGLIYSNSGPEELNLSIFEIFSGDQTFQDRIKNALSSAEEGEFQTQQHLVAYQPVTLGVQKWLLIISSPAQEVMDLTIPFYVRQMVMFIMTTAIILLVGTVALRKNQV